MNISTTGKIALNDKYIKYSLLALMDVWTTREVALNDQNLEYLLVMQKRLYQIRILTTFWELLTIYRLLEKFRLYHNKNASKRFEKTTNSFVFLNSKLEKKDLE